MTTLSQRISDGQKTVSIYTLISNQSYEEAAKILTHELQFCQKSRVQSLLGYCYFQQGDFGAAARIYEELANIYPEVPEYRYYHALSQYKNGDLEAALRAAGRVESEAHKEKVAQLLAYIKYEQEEWTQAAAISSEWSHDDISAVVLRGALNLRQNKIVEALKCFETACGMNASDCQLIYNVALCHYKAKEYDKCMHCVADIIARGARSNSELLNVKHGEGFLVNDSQALKRSALIECFNLKAAIEFGLKQNTNAREALLEMPHRREEILDPVTLMNHALLFFDQDPALSFKKLNFLLENPPFPSETFANLLLLYAKVEYFDLAADVMAENPDLTAKCIAASEADFIDALVYQHASPEEADRKLAVLSASQVDQLRRVTQMIKEAQSEKDNDQLQIALRNYDELLERFVPILTAHAKIFWNREDYAKVEEILLSAKEYCSINDTWRLNLAHCFFVQEKYTEALTYYNAIYEKNAQTILEIPAIVVANLCVTCIMANQNERAEEIIHALEEAELQAEEAHEDPHYHLCIVNLVIGTLYCSKNNYHFGITRILKSFEPLNKKLSMDTWFHAKRCFLSLAEKLSKNYFIFEDALHANLISFLLNCEESGQKIKARIDPGASYDSRNSVAYEARLLRFLFLKLRD